MSLTISALEFDVLWEHLRFDHAPLVLSVPSPGKTHTERAELANAVWDSLAERGLVGGSCGIDARLVDLLSLLDKPQYEIDARLWLGPGVRAVAASRGQDGVLAVLSDEVMTLRHIVPEALPHAVLSLLPELPAGPGYSVTVPSADLDSAVAEAGAAEELPYTLRDRGVSAQDADELAAMVRKVVARGQFGAAARDRWGRRHRPDRVVGFFDTPRGRYVQLRRTEPGGQAWSTLAPADRPRLGQHVVELVNEAAAQAR